MSYKPSLIDRFNQKVFDALYQRSLVYNTCWEDPAVDRQALHIGSDDKMLVITSAGCNVLDYALCGPSAIHAVDANPRQTALLELKLTGIRQLQHSDFFGFFGDGSHPRAKEIYNDTLRQHLSPFAQTYWDKHINWFQRAQKGDTFYHFGLAGIVARMFRSYLKMRPKLRAGVHSVFDAANLDEQRDRYDNDVAPYLWGKAMNWALSRSVTMSLLGVPHPQREEVKRSHDDGIAGFIRESIEYVFRCLPAKDNYFWSVYVYGKYTPECCPEYLKPANFQLLKDGLVDNIIPHTTTVTQFLQETDEKLTRFVLLDHMDWMSVYHPDALREEWQAILDRATPDARIIFRSAHPEPNYLDQITLPDTGERLMDKLVFEPDLAAKLHVDDRVHTYAGFHILSIPG